MARAYQVQVGDISCAMLHEGGSPLTIDGLMGRYPDVTEAQFLEVLDGRTALESSINPLYIDTGETKILADVGFGEARRPEMGNVEPALNSIGVSLEDIDIVFLTHFHGDHIAGLVTPEGKPAYPNARYVASQAEWDEWIPRWEASDQEGQKQQLAMMKSLENQLTLVNDGDEIATGVRVVAIAGHTLGQMGLLVESNGERLIHLADVLHQPFQFQHMDWIFKFDSDGALGIKTRQQILKRCADENLLTSFYHLPFPGVGHVASDGNAYVWQAIDS